MEPSLSKNAVAAAPASAPSVWSQIDLRQIMAPSSTQFRGTQMFSLLLALGVLLGLADITKQSLSADVNSVLMEAKILKLLSSMFVSTSPVWSVLHVVVMLSLGGLLEAERGTQCLLSVVMAVCFVSELLTLVTFLSLYYCTFDTFYLERTVCGFDAMMAAFVVALAELYPKRPVFASFSCTWLTFQVWHF